MWISSENIIYVLHLCKSCKFLIFVNFFFDFLNVPYFHFFCTLNIWLIFIYQMFILVIGDFKVFWLKWMESFIQSNYIINISNWFFKGCPIEQVWSKNCSSKFQCDSREICDPGVYEGCCCPEGLYKIGDRCVAKDQCPCINNGNVMVRSRYG